MWLEPVGPSSRISFAIYTPETAFAGTSHEPDTAQLPQSIRPRGRIVETDSAATEAG